MLDFFTAPYKDEFIYSTIARYHFYSGNVDFKDTIEECFGKRTMVPVFELAGGLDMLASKLGGKYTAEKILKNNTIFSYYEPFLDKKIKLEAINKMKKEDCSSIYTKIGIVAGSICKTNSIRYCPICAKNEIEAYGEVYIHREHQLQGIKLCPHDGCVLKEYAKRKLDSSKIEFVRLDKENLDLEEDFNIEQYDKNYILARNAYYLLNADLSMFDNQKLKERYVYYLNKKGLARDTGTIKQRDLYEEFINFYGNEFLKSLQCQIDFDNEYNWLKVLTRKSKRATHPLRHLLLIGFLCSSIEEFFFEDINIIKLTSAHEKNRKIVIDDKVIEYRKSIIEFIRSNSEMSRTEVRKNLKKEYIYLYRHDCNWLLDNLPKKKEQCNGINERVDWQKRDKEYLQLLKDRYKVLINGDEIIRITKGTLAKPLGILANLEKKIDKFPETKKYLMKICESIEEFQIRRCKYVIDNLFINEKNIKLWKVQRIAGIRSSQFDRLKNTLIK
ncbi:TnsD family transposase [Clostridium sp. MSJ-8]|uniref:TnsD family Tn7-like transposition protein n=1 Tax=Clostridium sp. MSJ-8 TaxID=2841510 RepID=UPI001C0F26F8|nr:TnsD family Tn7-like transposition protein [Clostridium sp. MSJ-8]MBU5488536.1 TnsD family transposase [Clostridium sp. MSJ-8]